MSVEERLARLETSQAGHGDWLRSIDGKVDGQQAKLIEIGVKVDDQQSKLATIGQDVAKLVKASHMGEGAWWVLVKVGLLLGGIIAGVAWLFDHIKALLHG